jgi:hypothetical protein
LAISDDEIPIRVGSHVVSTRTTWR